MNKIMPMPNQRNITREHYIVLHFLPLSGPKKFKSPPRLGAPPLGFGAGLALGFPALPSTTFGFTSSTLSVGSEAFFAPLPLPLGFVSASSSSSTDSYDE